MTTATAETKARPTTTLETKVRDFLACKRIAVVGVSRDNRHHPAANLIYRRFKRTGYDVFPVNPNMQSFDGDHCYSSVQSIPGGIDAVVIVTRPEITEQVVHDCAEIGVRHIWMHQSAAKNSSVSPRGVEYGNERGISVIAGACPMMYGEGVDFGHRCMRWFLGLSGGLPS